MLPSRVAWAAAVDNEELIRVIDGTGRAGFDARPAEQIPMPKIDGGTRPAADLPIEDQLVYTALAKVLSGAAFPGLVTFTGTDISYAEFERYPLQFSSTHKYVFVADVVSFYEFINHDQLIDQLIGLTGLADVAESLGQLLEIWMGKSQGVPQGPRGSEPIADIYLAPASRALLRAGFEHSRYSDDFRIPVRSWSESRHAQVVLEGALRDLGLVVSGSKARTPRIDTYESQYVGRTTAPVGLSPTERDVLETEENEYVGGEVPAIPSDEDLARAERILSEETLKLRADIVSTRTLRWALPRLGLRESVSPLTNFEVLLRRHAHITASTAFYCQLLMRSDLERQAVSKIIEWVDSASFKFPWQLGWLLNASVYASRRYPALQRRAGRVFLDSSMPWFVRAQAALVLAAQQAVPERASFSDVYERAPKASRPDLLAAVVIGQPPWGASFIRAAADTPLLRAVADFSHDEFPSWI
jgi:hypothetical protein